MLREGREVPHRVAPAHYRNAQDIGTRSHFCTAIYFPFPLYLPVVSHEMKI